MHLLRLCLTEPHVTSLPHVKIFSQMIPVVRLISDANFNFNSKSLPQSFYKFVSKFQAHASRSQGYMAFSRFLELLDSPLPTDPIPLPSTPPEPVPFWLRIRVDICLPPRL